MWCCMFVCCVFIKSPAIRSALSPGWMIQAGTRGKNKTWYHWSLQLWSQHTVISSSYFRKPTCGQVTLAAVWPECLTTHSVTGWTVSSVVHWMNPCDVLTAQSEAVRLLLGHWISRQLMWCSMGDMNWNFVKLDSKDSWSQVCGNSYSYQEQCLLRRSLLPSCEG